MNYLLSKLERSKKGWQFSGPRNKKMADLAKSQGLDALLATSSENFAYLSGLAVPSYKSQR